MEKGGIREDSERSQEDSLLFCSDRSFFIFFFSLLLLGVTVLGVRVSYLESILLGLCVSPVTSSPSFMLLSRRGQPLPAGLYKAVSGH